MATPFQTQEPQEKEPRPPEHSLPSYGEPTPETRAPISREEEAERALLSTSCTPGVRLVLIGVFLVTILSLPAINLLARLRPIAHPSASPGAEVLALLPSRAQLGSVQTLRDFSALLPRAEEIKKAEKELERDSIVTQYLLPRVQSFLTGVLQAGNEQAYLGRDGWLFYRADVDHLTGPPFLDPARLRVRSRDLGIQPDPVKGIVHFRDQLAARGIELILLPVPVKPAVDGEMLGDRVPAGTLLANPSAQEFHRRLGEAGLRVVPVRDAMSEWKKEQGNELLYLATDTHWRPETMHRVAQLVASFLPKGSASFGPAAPVYAERTARGLGDIATMLKLPTAQALYPPQTVSIQPVQVGDGLWRSTPSAPVLLLGDSFSNIFSLAGMGWGEAAGLAEHLSVEAGTPLDCILRNSDGAFATREMLNRELARGHDRLAGKRVVIWEFAERELSFGDWKLLPMELGSPQPGKFLAVKEGQEIEVQATVSAVTAIPRPGSVPYADHIFNIHLEEISGPMEKGSENVQAVAFLWSMREGAWTPAARLRPGDRVRVRLSSWPGTHPDRLLFNRSEFPTDSPLALEEPLWAELIERE